MSAVGAAVGDGVERLERRRDLAGRRRLDGEAAVGHVGDRVGQRLGAAVVEIERGREARRRGFAHCTVGVVLTEEGKKAVGEILKS